MYQVQYPTNYELKLLEPDLMSEAMLSADPIFADFPITAKPVHNIEWVMKENISGLQAARGLDGQAPRVQALGASMYAMAPGVYGEQEVISERELTTRAPYNAPGAVINIDDLVVERLKQLVGREVTRVRSNIWTLLTTGVITVIAPGTGATQVNGQYDIRKISYTDTTDGLANVPWATVATSKPLQDLQAVQQLYEAGTSCRFGTNAKMYMNRRTFNYIINSVSLGTRIVAGMKGLLPGMSDIANLFENFGLPAPIVMNDGYLDDSQVWQYYIPDNKVVLIGTRPNNDVLGEYVQTRNAQNPNFDAGPYIKIVDDPDLVPRNIVIHRGHNGGPAIYFPNGVIILSVG
jgi:hypothetical protein